MSEVCRLRAGTAGQAHFGPGNHLFVRWTVERCLLYVDIYSRHLYLSCIAWCIDTSGRVPAALASAFHHVHNLTQACQLSFLISARCHFTPATLQHRIITRTRLRRSTHRSWSHSPMLCTTQLSRLTDPRTARCFHASIALHHIARPPSCHSCTSQSIAVCHRSSPVP